MRRNKRGRRPKSLERREGELYMLSRDFTWSVSMIRIENRQPKAKRGYFAKFLNFKVAFYTKETTYVRIFF